MDMPKHTPTIQELINLPTLETAQISPDGRFIAYQQSTPDWEKDAYISQIWLVNSEGEPEPRQLTFTPNGSSQPHWSPDGCFLSFISKREEDKVSQIYRLAITGGEAERLEHQEWAPILYTKDSAIRAKTPAQAKYIDKAAQNDLTFAIGPAGTGKTYLAVALAVANLRDRQVSRIVLTRPAVEAGESLGFLPGDLLEKVDPYLRPLYDALSDMLQFDKLQRYLDTKIVEVIPLAYMRGRTINNAFVILDEAQNTTPKQMKMFLTRLGIGSKAIVTGDITQIDLPPGTESGLIQAQAILSDVAGIDFVYLSENDVVRHRLVRDIINAYNAHNAQK